MTIRSKDLPNLEDLCAAELRSLVVSLLETVAQLEAKVAALTEENARLKRLKGRPTLKPSGVEKGTDAAPAVSGKTDRPPRRRNRGEQRLDHADGAVVAAVETLVRSYVAAATRWSAQSDSCDLPLALAIDARIDGWQRRSASQTPAARRR